MDISGVVLLAICIVLGLVIIWRQRRLGGISWNEPIWGYVPRVNEKLKTIVAQTSIWRVIFLLFIVLPAAYYFMIRLFGEQNPNLTWANLILSVIIIAPVAALFFLLVQYMPPSSTLNKKGVYITGSAVAEKHSLSEIDSLLIRDQHGARKSLVWKINNKETACAISKRVDIAALKELIEKNSTNG